jgi:hypothetical protein
MDIPKPIIYEIRRRIKEAYPTRQDKHDELIDQEVNCYLALNKFEGVPFGFDRNMVIMEARKKLYRSYIEIYDYLQSEIEVYKKLLNMNHEAIPADLIKLWMEEAKTHFPREYTGRLNYCETRYNQYLHPQDDFVCKIRSLCEENISSSVFFKSLINELKKEYIAGSEYGFVYKDYIEPLIAKRIEAYRLKLIAEANDDYQKNMECLQTEYSEKMEKLEHDYLKKKGELELEAIYRTIDEKIINEPGFLSIALKKIQDDVLASKNRGEFPHLYEMTLKKCNQELLVKFLVDRFREDLLVRFESSLKAGLLKTYKDELLQKVKNDLMADKNIIEGIKVEIKRDLLRQMFG